METDLLGDEETKFTLDAPELKALIYICCTRMAIFATTEARDYTDEKVASEFIFGQIDKLIVEMLKGSGHLD
jgi:hypothetical protein